MNILFWKKIHNWAGLGSALFLTVLLATGILLNHPDRLERRTLDVLALDPHDPAVLFSGGKDGLSRSADGGKTWDELPMLYPPQEVSDLVFSPDRPHQLFALERWGRIFRSDDGGKIWTTTNLPFDPQVAGIELKKISPGPAGRLAVLTSHGWLSSDDLGQTWNTEHFDPDARPLRRTILLLHNGYFFGPKFVWIYDGSALALLALIVTGLILWKTGKKVV
jgi:hypothetical protein